MVHKKCLIMIVISSREFRANQKLYFEKADAGAENIEAKTEHIN